MRATMLGTSPTTSAGKKVSAYKIIEKYCGNGMES